METTLLGTLGLITLTTYNGVEPSEYLTPLQAVREVQAESTDSDD
jgi:hypothetical protein